ncbi:MAG: NADH-quinone oxidoreductase subunit C [Deltaproteobacteria bacterium]|nr:NADH-quinone oxidoreductase subunit C [Deltaproteobacteria bacterium]
MSDLLDMVVSGLMERLGERAGEVVHNKMGTTMRVSLDAIPATLDFLKNYKECPFDLLSDITAVDWSQWEENTGLKGPPTRFTLLYNLYSIQTKERIFIEAAVSEGQKAPSATRLYASANWAEREVFDMFGIKFSGHPDLKRIFLPEEFEYYPLRKEYPRTGYDPQDFPQE